MRLVEKFTENAVHHKKSSFRHEGGIQRIPKHSIDCDENHRINNRSQENEYLFDRNKRKNKIIKISKKKTYTV